MSWTENLPVSGLPKFDAERLRNLQVGALSPLWLTYAGAVAAGAATWNLTRLMRLAATDLPGSKLLAPAAPQAPVIAREPASFAPPAEIPVPPVAETPAPPPPEVPAAPVLAAPQPEPLPEPIAEPAFEVVPDPVTEAPAILSATEAPKPPAPKPPAPKPPAPKAKPKAKSLQAAAARPEVRVKPASAAKPKKA